MHFLFSFSIGERQNTNFTSNISQGLDHHCTMLIPSVARFVVLTLDWISDINHHDQDFGGPQLLFINDLLGLSPVVKNMVILIVRRMITRFPSRGSIHQFILRTPQRCSK
jgi:hypothetical protein